MAEYYPVSGHLHILIDIQLRTVQQRELCCNIQNDWRSYQETIYLPIMSNEKIKN